jgi:hypothetical protein
MSSQKKKRLVLKETVECNICCEGVINAETGCFNGHQVCSNCYKQLEKCPYCQIIYRYPLCCRYGGNHKLTMMERETHFIEMPGGDEREGLMINLIESIKCQTYVSPNFDDCEVYEMNLYGVFKETSKYLGNQLNEYMNDINKLLIHLPIGIKLYLSKLSEIERAIWEKNLKTCVINLVIRMGSAKHMHYLYACERCPIAIKKKLYMGILKCIADEYILYRILHKEWDEKLKGYDRLCEIYGETLPSSMSLRTVIEFLVLDLPRNNIRCYFGDLENYDRLGNLQISPCDWFENYTEENLDTEL